MLRFCVTSSMSSETETRGNVCLQLRLPTMKTIVQTVLFISCVILLIGVFPNGDAYQSNDDQAGGAVATAPNPSSARSRSQVGLRVVTGHVLGYEGPASFDTPARSSSHTALCSSHANLQALCLLRC